VTDDNSGNEIVPDISSISRRDMSDAGAVSRVQDDVQHAVQNLDWSQPKNQRFSRKIISNERHHRHRMEWARWFTDFAERFLLPALCIICAFGSVTLFVFGALYFVRHHSPQQGALILSGGLVAAVGGFLSYRGVQILKDKSA
jgi:hypothetical protein